MLILVSERILVALTMHLAAITDAHSLHLVIDCSEGGLLADTE